MGRNLNYHREIKVTVSYLQQFDPPLNPHPHPDHHSHLQAHVRAHTCARARGHACGCAQAHHLPYLLSTKFRLNLGPSLVFFQ